MFRGVAFLTKRQGIEMQAFIDHYENKHVPLICSLAPAPIVYKRRYLVRGEELTKEGGAIDFDVMTELGFPDPGAFSPREGPPLRTWHRRAGCRRRGEVSRSAADQGLRRRRTRDVRVSFAA